MAKSAGFGKEFSMALESMIPADSRHWATPEKSHRGQIMKTEINDSQHLAKQGEDELHRREARKEAKACL